MSASQADLEADDRARVLAVSEFDAPVVLEAGAGTGKTTLLVARLATWLSGRGFETRPSETEEESAERALDGVLALTFTEAAAAEMDQRLREALAELARGALPRSMIVRDDADLAARSARARRLLAHLDRPIATTIHAWCRQLLAEEALAAGVDPSFVVDADGRELRRAVRAACEASLARGAANEQGAWAAVVDAGLDPAAVERAVLELARKGARAADFAGDPASAERLEGFRARLAQSLDDFVRAAAGPLAGVPRNSTKTLAARAALVEIAERVAAFEPSSGAIELAWSDLSTIAAGAAEEKCSAWAGEGFNSTETKALGAALADAERALTQLAPLVAALAACDPRTLRAAHALVQEILRDAQASLRARGFLGFEDLVRGASDALRDERIAARVRRGLRQVLVDEFQDTDARQCAIFERLALDGPSPRPGLFVVGDPKQSIYGWRGADLAAYERFVERTGAQARVLVRNGRSTVRVLDGVARLVEPAMEYERGVQPRFQPLDSRSGEEGGPVEIVVSGVETHGRDPERATTRELAAVEARLVARDLVERLARGARWRDAAILARSASHLDEILPALREHGVPFEVASDRRWYQRREIADALALAASIADPHDLLSLVAALRSPWCGVPDAAWIALDATGLFDVASSLSRLDDAARARIGALVERARARLPRRLPDGGEPEGVLASLRAALATLARLRESLREESAAEFVERLETATLAAATEGARYLGGHRRRALTAFCARLAELVESHAGDARAALRELRRASREGERFDEKRSRSSARDAVSVMTIHAAKGLEFEHVYLVAAHRAGERSRARESDLAPDGESVVAGIASLGWSGALEARTRRERAERVRLLYVATTRAKRRLVICCAWPAKGPDRAKAARGASFLQRMAHGLAGAHEAVAAALSEARPRFSADGFDVRTWFDLSGASAVAEASAAACDVDVAALAREAVEMGARRKSAAARMARRFVAPASASPESAAELALARGDADEAGDSFDVDVETSDGADAGVIGTAARGTARQPSLERDVARAAGIAVHAVLESALAGADFRASTERDERVLASVARTLRAPRDDGRVASAARAAAALVERFADGDLGRRFERLLPRALARELALVARPRTGGAIAAETGAVDLVAVDDDGALLVVDFKTESVVASDLLARAERHRPQLEAYGAALSEALGLRVAPRLEVWFLAADRAVPLT